jgi:transcriptional regulator with XRE-family HTH domain
MKSPVDVQIGQRLRQKRWLSRMTQQQLADAVGIRFQQIQKYESGANRISAARLWRMAQALDVPISFFYAGIDGAEAELASGGDARVDSKETFELVRAYYALSEPARRQMLALAQTLNDELKPAAHIRLSADDAR